MQNPILDLINSLEPGNVNTNGLMQSAGRRIESGFNSLQKVADNLDEVRKNKAIKELVSTTDMSDPYSGQQTMLGNLLGIRGVDAKDAMNISGGIANPLIARNNRAEDVTYRTNTFNESTRHNKAMENKGFAPKGYGMTTDEYGTTYMYNKDTGKYEAIVNGNANNGAVPPKFIGNTSVVDTDPATGIETKKQVSFDKRNPTVDLNGNPITSVSYPTITKDDRDYLQGIPTMNKMVTDLSKIIDTSSGSFGPVDQYTGKIGAMLGKDEGTAQTKARAISSNLLAGFGKAQMAGVLTDQDMKIIKEQIPSVSDTQAEAQTKMKFLKDFLKTKTTAWIKEKERTNPGFVPKDVMDKISAPAIPAGAVDNGDGTITMPNGQVYRKKG